MMMHRSTMDTVRQWPQANVAIDISHEGLLVLDIGACHGGSDAFDELIAKLGPLAHTVECSTGGAGFHLCFNAPPGDPIASGKLAAGIDIMVRGGYVIVPPCNHVTSGSHTGREGRSSVDLDVAGAIRRYGATPKTIRAAFRNEEGERHILPDNSLNEPVASHDWVVDRPSTIIFQAVIYLRLHDPREGGAR